MATMSNQGMKHLLQTLGRELVRELDLWIPFIPDDNQTTNEELRSGIVGWLATLNQEFGFSLETLFLTVDIFDRFLRRVKAQTKYFKCIAVSCFYLAAKVNEEDEIIPLTWELVRHSKCGCSEAEVLRMERCVLAKLNWDLKASRTSIEFIHLFYAMVMTKCPTLLPTKPGTGLPTLTQALLLCLSHAQLLAYAPSTVALAVLSLYLELTCVYWLPTTRTLQNLTQLTDEELLECRQLVSKCLGASVLDAVRNNALEQSREQSRHPSVQVQPIAIRASDELMDSSCAASQKLPLPPSPVTPHPPAKRRKVEQDDDVYDDIRSLYDTTEESWSGDTPVSSGVLMSLCASQVLHANGVVNMASPIASS
jgi:hypothetical protein